uniref:LTA synthase family protein n=1 Tax=Mariniflexile sp. TaxID=1979402 RepID=UPI0040478407
YLFVIPKKWHGSILDKIIIYSGFSLSIFILFFSFLGEIAFWEEFERRYNFIAVDYLIYTYEVVKNINESYPLPILISALLALTLTCIFITYRLGNFKQTFRGDTPFKSRFMAGVLWLLMAIASGVFVTNAQADFSDNRYNNELAKTGIYSFFAAFRNNELPYSEFYKTIPNAQAYAMVKQSYYDSILPFINPNENSIYRRIVNSDRVQKPMKPNVIFLFVESLSGNFLQAFGNPDNLTPTLDSLANNSLFFTNLYATGTRTVRGMEAVTLSIPPNPRA